MLQYLIVEDAQQLREALVDFFVTKSAGTISFDEAGDGNTAMELIKIKKYDLVLLDIMLPGISGFELCREIRRNSICPIIFITALGSEDSILKGYELGADDYVTKPFSLKTLYAKSLAIVDRYKGFTRKSSTIVGNIELNPTTMQVFASGKEVELPPKEYFVLKLLMENENKVFSRAQLIDNVWGIDFDGSDRVVDTHIKNLRKLLGTAGKQITTVVGGGYKVTQGK